ncbi:MAG: hypothetical protein IJ845_08205 [Bacteroidaceae bacterium]|nr:hypothetical protein [Bacteroidaceae bacterium]
MIQTHYVQLQPPYRIIYSGGAMGLQIGTLIVTFSPEQSQSRLGNRSGFPRMTSKTYPVVSYVNKNLNELSDDFITRFEGGGGSYSEAVVWDQVDQSEVLTVCYEGQSLSWEDFLHLLEIWIHWCRDEESAWKEFGKARSFVENLLKLGGTIQVPDWLSFFLNNEADDSYEVLIPLGFITLSELFELKEGEEGKLYIGTGFTDKIPMGAPNCDYNEMYNILSVQNSFYRWFLDKIAPENNILLHYTIADPPAHIYDTKPTEDDLVNLEVIVDRLNGKKI